MTYADEHNTLASRDGDVVDQLRELQRQRKAGEINQDTFDHAYRALNRQVDTQCDRCGASPAPLKRGTAVYCGRCYQETA